MVNTSPPQQQKTEAPNRHIPPEMVEQILLNLPLTSLPRFSCVSTSWKSMITSPEFVAKHGGGKKILIINDNPSFFDVSSAFCSPLSSAGNTTSLNPVCPFKRVDREFKVFSDDLFRADVKLKAFSDELWCVVAKNSLYLLNPATGAYKKLRDAPPLGPPRGCLWSKPSVKDEVFVYGLGYDAANDDYKLLQIWSFDHNFGHERSLLYSLKKDSWREIESNFLGDLPSSDGLFVNGALHWMVIGSINNNSKPPFYSSLIYFDFSTEEFRFLKQPKYCSEPDLERDVVDVAVLSSKLCVFLNYNRSYWNTGLVLWAMEYYGVAESWTKLYEISYKSIPPIVSEFCTGARFTLRPMYLYEDDGIVIWACSGHKKSGVIVYKDGNVVAHSKIVAPRGDYKDVRSTRRGPRSRVRGGFVYVESLVSPTRWE